MTTASAAALAADATPKKATHTLHLDRGAAYLLEGILQDPGPCTTPNKLVRWSRLWQKVRAVNPHTIYPSVAPDGVDFEKAVVIEENETQPAYQRRTAAHADAFEVWRVEPIELGLSDKQREIAREAMKWVIENQKNPQVRFKITQSTHVEKLLVALGFGPEEDDDAPLRAIPE